jgi:hypothetical protein
MVEFALFLNQLIVTEEGVTIDFLPPTTETVFRNPIWANACWGFGSTAEYILGSNPGIDCRVYGMSNQMFEEKKRQAEYTKRQLDESLRRLQQTGN